MKKIYSLLFVLPFLSISQTQIGADIDGEAASDQSGWSVSLNSSGNIMVIGSPYNNGNGSSSGHVRIYEYNGSNWIQLGADIEGESVGNFSGISVSINSTGNRVAIGANHNNENGSNSGHVRIYEYNGSNWIQLGTDIDGETALDYSGTSVSINGTGNIVAIGANRNDGNGVNSGHVRIYEYNGSNWIQLGTDIDGETAGSESGTSVSINSTGDRVAIGSPKNTGNGTDSGHVRIYEYNGSNWIQLGTDIDGESAYDYSGTSVSINDSGNRVAIGSPYNTGNGSSSGHVRIYEYNGSNWIKLGTDIEGEDVYNQSGKSVSLNSLGNIVIIGAHRNDGNGGNSGHARIYEYNGSNWIQLGTDIDGENTLDQFGWSVSINSSGDRVAIGAPVNDGNGTNSGHVRVYQLIPLSIKTNTFGEKFSIYPNPTISSSTVNLGNTYQEVEVGIYNILGKQISTKNYNNVDSIKIDSSVLSNGIYLVKVNSGTKEAIIKLVKK